MSDPVRIMVKGDDVSGVTLSLHALASISGHVIFETDPKIDCAKRRATARQETIIAVRRFTAPPTSARNSRETAADVPLLYNNIGRDAGVDEKSDFARSEEHTSELQSHSDLVCRLLLEKKK